MKGMRRADIRISGMHCATCAITIEDAVCWFVKEQREEEANASDILAQIKIVGDIPGHLFWLDHQLGRGG